MISLKVVRNFLFLLVATFLAVNLVAVLNIKANPNLPRVSLLFKALPGFYQGTKPTLASPDSYPTSPPKVAMSRKTRPPFSWFIAVRDAEVAFTGEARLVKDTGVSASDTSFRGKGYQLTSQVNIQEFLFGSLTDRSITLEGETQRTPTHRLTLESSLFPPDTLHKILYWDYAQSDMVQPVLVVLSKPVVIVNDPEDHLPEAIQLIKSWLRLPTNEQRSNILESLSEQQRHPVAYVAGFELLMSEKSVLSDLFEDFDSLPARPGAAIQGIVDKLYIAATGLTNSEIKKLAQKLLDSWSRESDPSALCSYLVWFDAHRERTWSQDETMREAVLAQAKRAKAIHFSGENSDLWEQRVQQYTSVLLAD